MKKGEEGFIQEISPAGKMVWVTKTYFSLALNKKSSMISEKYSTASFSTYIFKLAQIKFSRQSPRSRKHTVKWKYRKEEDEIEEILPLEILLSFFFLQVMFLILNWFMFSMMPRQNGIGAKCWCTGKWDDRSFSQTRRGRNYDFGISVMFFPSSCHVVCT